MLPLQFPSTLIIINNKNLIISIAPATVKYDRRRVTISWKNIQKPRLKYNIDM